MKDITSDGTNYEGFEEPDTVRESYCNSKKHFSSELADIVCCCMIIAGKENCRSFEDADNDRISYI